MNLDLILARLAPLKPAPLAFMAGAAEFDPERMSAPAYPALWVLPSEEKALPSDDHGATQKVGVDVGLAIAIQSLRDSSGKAAGDALYPVRLALRQRLLGWRPDKGMGKTSFVLGNVLAFRPGLLLWMDVYRSHYLIEAEPVPGQPY